MDTRGGDFERTLGRGLAAHVGKVESCRIPGLRGAWFRPGESREFGGPRDQGDDFGQMLDAEYVHAFHHSSLGGIVKRKHQVGNTVAPRANGHRQRSADGADATVER